MTLGEKITALRSQRGMSQGDLAEKINVSRQSISKWETDSSIPELDKLLQLSELFGVTLDELVKGETVPAANHTKQTTPPPPAAEKSGSTRKIVGTILLCFGALIVILFALLGGFLGGLAFGAPFLLCGVICLMLEQNTGLWCAWAVFLTVNIYLRFATGITWSLTLLTLRYEPSMNYMRLAMAWAELLCFIALITVTVLRFRKKPLTMDKRRKTLYIVGWVVFALLFVPFRGDPLSALSNIRYVLWDWLKVGLFVPLLTTTLRWYHTRKTEKEA